MRLFCVAIVIACKSSEQAPDPKPEPVAAAKPAPKPPDEMDERMRHCPLALDGATSTLADIDGGVRFTIEAPRAAIDEVRRRAHHVVEFAAKRTREGHGGFDGKGPGRMRNCPVITDDVAITAIDEPTGAHLDIVSSSGHAAELRAESRERAKRFPFVGAAITIK